MRKSTAIVLTIIVLAFGGMMVAANVALKPYKRYAEIAGEITGVLRNLEMIEPESKVFVLGRTGGEGHLAQEGFGLFIEFTPSEGVRRSKGRTERVAYRAIQEARRLYERGPGRELGWFEIKVVLPAGEPHRCLVTLDADGALGPPEPAIPTVVP